MTQRVILLQALASTPADIIRLLRPLPESAANWKPVDCVWSAHDIMNHLLQEESAFQYRFNRVIRDHQPVIQANLLDRTEFPRDENLAELGPCFRLARESTIANLQSIEPSVWQRAAIHETRGRITLRTLVNDLVVHDIEQSNQLAKILQSWRVNNKIGL